MSDTGHVGDRDADRDEAAKTVSATPPVISFSFNPLRLGSTGNLILCVIALLLVLRVFSPVTDTTDQDFWHRSGMAVYTDNATGLQYLASPYGGMTPRLDRDGKQMRAPVQ